MGATASENGAKVGQTQAPQRVRPWPYLFWILLAVGPLVVAGSLLQLLGPLGGPLSVHDLGRLRGALTTEPFLPGALTLITVLAVHVCVCLGGIVLAVVILRRIYEGFRPALLVASLGLMLGLGVLLLGVWAHRSLTIYRMSYFQFIDLYLGTGAEASLLHPRVLGLDALTISILLPVGLGIIGVALMMAAMLGEVQALGPPPEPEDKPYEAQLQFAYARLKRCLYILSVGLVTSTVAASLFFHLPSKLSAPGLAGGPTMLEARFDRLGPAGVEATLKQAELAGRLNTLQSAELTALRTKFDEFAAELSIYWGAVFTLTLIVAAGLPVALLQHKVRLYSEKSGEPNKELAAQERLETAGVLGDTAGQVKLLLALIAPLASGPISNFVQAVAGG